MNATALYNVLVLHYADHQDSPTKVILREVIKLLHI